MKGVLNLDDIFLLLGIISLLLMILGIIKPNLVLRWGNKKTRKRVLRWYGLSFIIFSILFNVAYEEPIDTNINTNNINSQTTSEKKEKIYDGLEKLYLDIEPNMSYETVLEIVKNSGLPYSEDSHFGSNRRGIKIAFSKGVTPHTHAKESGDYVSIAFEDTERNKNFTIKHMKYFNHDKFVEAVQFVDGVYWQLRGTKDAGLYINNYTNLMSGKDKYEKQDSKKAQLDYIDKYEKQS